MGGCNGPDCNCGQLKRQIIALEARMSVMEEGAGPLLEGHPVWVIDEDTDIAMFDTTTGWGAGPWAAWAIANGDTYTRNGVTVTTKDYRDRMTIGAGSTYSVGDTGGAATHTLTIPELPVVTLTVTDPGHTHSLTDPGHTHNLTDPGHTHAATAAPHTHTGTTDTTGDHTHDPTTSPTDTFVTSNNNGTFVDGAGTSEVNVDGEMAAAGDHSHTLNIDSTTVAVTNANAFTGATVDSNTTGATVDSDTTGITIDPFGAGDPHNNLPPYLGVLYVQRIG